MNPQGEYCTKEVKAFKADRKRQRPPYKAANCLGTGPHRANNKDWIAVRAVDGRVFWQEHFPGTSFVPSPTAEAAGAPPPGATSGSAPTDFSGVSVSEYIVDSAGSLGTSGS